MAVPKSILMDALEGVDVGEQSGAFVFAVVENQALNRMDVRLRVANLNDNELLIALLTGAQAVVDMLGQDGVCEDCVRRVAIARTVIDLVAPEVAGLHLEYDRGVVTPAGRLH